MDRVQKQTLPLERLESLRTVPGWLVVSVLLIFPASARADGAASFVIGGLLVSEGADRATPTGLKRPFGIDFLADGTMFIVELEGGRVYRRPKNGPLELFSGDGSRSYRGDGGPASNATYDGMHNVAIARDGSIYIADSWNHCIRRIDANTSRVSTFAGTGEAGFAGDGQTAREARFDFLMCVSLDPAETGLYIADLKNRRIRRIDLKTNRVTTVAGNGQRGVPADGAVAIDAPLVDPRAVAVARNGQIYVLERGGNALRVVDNDGRIQTVAGTGKQGYRDGPALMAQFGSPKHLAVDDAGRVFIADDLNRAIRMYDPKTKQVATVLGRGVGSPVIDLKNPHGVCIEGQFLYVVDTSNHRILRMPLPK